MSHGDPPTGSLSAGHDVVLDTESVAAAAGLPIADHAPESARSPTVECWGGAADAVRTLDDIRRSMSQDVGAAHAAALRLVVLLGASVADERPCFRGGLAPWQKRVIDRYMLQRLDEPLRVKDLAERISLSVSYFCRAFKQSFGTSPHLYLNRLRVERAQQLMLTTSEPLIQIALACGMADQAHFSKFFRRAVGDSPSSWRRRNLTDAHAAAMGRWLPGSIG